jgi:CheY-like chemotaxis protein
MNVLLADDSSTIRTIVKRCLVKEFDCTVTEAENGIEALRALDDQRFSLVVLDVHMPVMDGLEALEMLRDSVHSAVPVVMLTSDRDQDLFNRAVFLGITDYLTKPLKPDTMVERLGKVLGALDTAATETEREDDDSPDVETDLTVMVAEGDPDHRHFLLDYFGSRCEVLEASTGAEALQLCLSTTPQMVFVGGDLGIVDAPTLARKIRRVDALAETRVVASVPRNQLDAARADGVYDAVIARSFVAEIFQDQFERLTMRPDQLASTLEHVHPRFKQGLVTAIEHVFGMALATEVAALDSASPPHAADEVLATKLDLTLQHQRLTLGFELLVRTAEAGDLAARMTGRRATR